jgi:hypothetical protein
MSEEVSEQNIKYLDIKEFREFGYLQEANRQFFHPLGLALEVNIDDETGEETLGRVWDYRDDPEGMNYGEGVIDSEKAGNVVLEQTRRATERRARLGYWVQDIL